MEDRTAVTIRSIAGRTREFCQPVWQNWLCLAYGRTHGKGGWQNETRRDGKRVPARGRPLASLINDSFNFDIAVETAQDLEASFTWKPPPSTETRDADDHLAELKRTEQNESFDEVEVLEGNAFDLGGLNKE
ncbi:hypothetical protein DFJ58DRAFT_836841 [Suillus subalutaceus]|uniref:uncharacterized protein n=1 Tax=Suillus subalutaceus TaxID=48586 RepID=UPI001B86E572|nr:uncharacterized protein DFJ58DRAFT_836841 [Suillus subalutaceus]KAG1873022.1 hypothetical protein DFJ58DRAFT_836841 [Suillus subalutaceus]